MSPVRTPENERWHRSAEKIAILYELRGLWLELGVRTRSVLPVPEEWEHYFEDLRRGRLDIGPTIARFFDTVERRDLGWEGRRFIDKALTLLHRYADLCVPPDLAGRSPVLIPNTHPAPSGRVRGISAKHRAGVA